MVDDWGGFIVGFATLLLDSFYYFIVTPQNIEKIRNVDPTEIGILYFSMYF